MYPWSFSLNDHLSCMITEKYSLHLIEEETFRTALLYHLLTTLHDKQFIHRKCEHCWIQEDFDLKNTLNAFSHNEIRICANNDLNHLEEQKETDNYIILECCDSSKCLDKLYAFNENFKINSGGSLHVVVKLPEQSSIAQVILDRIVHHSITRKWFVLTDRLLYDHSAHWTYENTIPLTVGSLKELELNDSHVIHHVECSTSMKIDDSICCLEENMKDNVRFLLNKIEHWYEQGIKEELKTNTEEKEAEEDQEDNGAADITNTKSDVPEPQNHVTENLGGDSNYTEASFYIPPTSNKSTEDSIHTSEKRGDNQIDTAIQNDNNSDVESERDTQDKHNLRKCYVVCRSTNDFESVNSYLHERFRDVKGVLTCYLTETEQSIGDIDDIDVLIVLLPIDLLLMAKKCHDVDLLLIDVCLQTYSSFVEVHAKLLRMAPGLVIFVDFSNYEKFMVYETLLRNSVSIEYMGPRMSPDYWALKKLCDSFSATTYGYVDLHIQRKFKEDFQNGSMTAESIVYVPIISMAPNVVKADAITVPIKSSKEDLINKSDKSALRKAVTLLKEFKELDDEDQVINRGTFDLEDSKKFLNEVDSEQEEKSADVSKYLISPEDNVDVYKFKVLKMMDREADGNLITCSVVDDECLGICMKKSLDQIPTFMYYDHYGPIEMVSTYGISTKISKDDFPIVQNFQELVYDMVCGMKLKNKTYLEERTNCKIVLLRKEKTEWFIDYERMRRLLSQFVLIVDQKGEGLNAMNAKMQSDDESALFLRKHLLPELKTPLRIVHNRGKDWLTVMNEFPDQSKARTYREYYCMKYNVSLLDSETMAPLKELKRVLNSINCVDYSNRKKPTGVQMDVPESLCILYPLSFQLWRQLCLAPSLLYRLKQITTIHDLLKRIPEFSCSDLGEMTERVRAALIPPSAVEDTNNQELEFYGDAVLKYAIVAQLFLDNPNKSESYISYHKSNIVRNEQLYQIGIARQLHKCMFFEKFNPKVINSYLTVENHPYKTTDHSKQYNKIVSDVTESLLGALFFSECEQWLALLRWYGFNVATLKEFLVGKTFCYPKVMEIDKFHENFTTNQHLTVHTLRHLENVLGYKFKETLLYLEACTHVTYPRYLNPWSHSNQRLECIGDAVLDIMVTTALINRNIAEGRKYDHGQLSEMRSFIVCTYVLAVCAVKIDLHKHLKLMTTSHFPYLKKWVEKVKQLEDSQQLYSKIYYDAYVCCDGNDYVEVPKDMADCFEALVGAVYLDIGGNLQETWRYFEKYFSDIIDMSFAYMPISIYYHLASLSPEGQFQSLQRRVNGDYCWRWFDGNIDIVRTGRTSKVAKGRVVNAAVMELENHDT